LLCDITSSGSDGGSVLRHPQFVTGGGGTGDDKKNGDNNDTGVFIDCRAGPDGGRCGKDCPADSARLLYLRSGTQDRDYPEKN